MNLELAASLGSRAAMTHIPIMSALKWLLSRVFPRPHTPKPDVVRFEVLHSATPNSVTFHWKRQVIHLWGNDGVQHRIWEFFTSPRNIVIQGGAKEFAGLLPGTMLSVFPTIQAKTGVVEWNMRDALACRDYPYPEAVVASTPSTGIGGGGSSPQTRVIW
jgi:hypothetical protein